MLKQGRKTTNLAKHASAEIEKMQLLHFYSLQSKSDQSCFSSPGTWLADYYSLKIRSFDAATNYSLGDWPTINEMEIAVFRQ